MSNEPAIPIEPAVVPVAPSVDAAAIDAFQPSQLDDTAFNQFFGIEKDDIAVVDEAVGDAVGEAALADAESGITGDTESVPDATGAEAVAPVTPPVTPEVKTPRPFTAFGSDGTPMADPSVAEIELTIAGKVRREPLDKIVRMAQSGGYNEQLQAEVKQARETVPEMQARLTAYEAKLQEVISDPDAWLREVEAYQQAASPEARAERAEAELARSRAQLTTITASQQVASAAAETILPRFEKLHEQYPTVQFDEMLAQFSTLIAPYKGPDGAIPVHLLPHAAAVIDQAIAPYAMQLHETRTERASLAAKAKAQVAAATKAVETKAQGEVAKAKNEIARQIAPVGRAPGTGRFVAKPVAPKTPNEAADSALDRALEGIT